MPPTATSDNESRRYSKRLRRKMDVEKKYDDIFSSVVEQALSNESLRMSPPPAPLYEKKPVIRKRYAIDSSYLSSRGSVELSSSSRSVSECDSFDQNDVTSNSLAPSSENSNDDSDIEIIAVVPLSPSVVLKPIVEWKFTCECGRGFTKHQLLHHHLAIDHSPSNSSRCTKCFVNTKALRNAHICRICRQYTVSMDEHLRAHYQDRSGENALMECRRCYRAFPTLAEVRDHERRMHTTHRVHKHIQQSWACSYCNVLFATRHMRDSHLVAHIDRAVGGVWDKIAHMQELTTDQTLVNQCPMCYSVMGSRKSFRLHIIHKHLLQDPDNAISSLGLPTVADVVASMNQIEPKVEVKTEHDVIEGEGGANDVIEGGANDVMEQEGGASVQVKEELIE